MIREPVCAGAWYPQEKKDIEKYLNLNLKKEPALGIVSPHAGWMYSGKVAGEVYSRLGKYETYIIIGPNHTGLGAEVSIYSEGIWKMPMGDVPVDAEIAEGIIKTSEFAKSDTLAHSREHCIEVQVPFIQYFNSKVNIVPIIMRTDSLEICYDIANSITTAIKKSNKKILIIASSDMSHYESYEYAKKQDELAIDMILKLDAQGLVKTVLQHGISMCGVFPTAIMLTVAKSLGAKQSSLIKYATSGETSGDCDAVVGYAGIIVK